MKEIQTEWKTQNGADFEYKTVDIKKILEKITENQEEDDKYLLKNITGELETLYMEGEKRLNIAFGEIQNSDLKIIEKNLNNKKGAKLLKENQTKEKKIKKYEKNNLKTKIHSSSSESDQEILNTNENPISIPKKKPKVVKLSKQKDQHLKFNKIEEKTEKKTEEKTEKKSKKKQEKKSEKFKENENNNESDDASQNSLNEVYSKMLQNSKKPNKIYSQSPKLSQNPDTPKLEFSKSPTHKNKTPDITSSLSKKLRNNAVTPTIGTNKKSRLISNRSSLIPLMLSLENFEKYIFSILPSEHAQPLRTFIKELASKIPKDEVFQKTNENEEIEEKNFLVNGKDDEENESRISQHLSVQYSYKPNLLTNTVFNKDEIRKLSPNTRNLIKKSMIGHTQQCAEICEHLKRVLAIKYKTFGVRYPIKTPVFNLLM